LSVSELPQDEILARILFGKGSSALSALESIQLRARRSS
jgi:autotransporter translocation and assembly factor TamB